MGGAIFAFSAKICLKSIKNGIFYMLCMLMGRLQAPFRPYPLATLLTVGRFLENVFAPEKPYYLLET